MKKIYIFEIRVIKKKEKMMILDGKCWNFNV